MHYFVFFFLLQLQDKQVEEGKPSEHVEGGAVALYTVLWTMLSMHVKYYT